MHEASKPQSTSHINKSSSSRFRSRKSAHTCCREREWAGRSALARREGLLPPGAPSGAASYVFSSADSTSTTRRSSCTATQTAQCFMATRLATIMQYSDVAVDYTGETPVQLTQLTHGTLQGTCRTVMAHLSVHPHN